MPSNLFFDRVQHQDPELGVDVKVQAMQGLAGAAEELPGHP